MSNKTVKLEITEDEYDRYRKEAEKAGLSVSAYLKKKMKRKFFSMKDAVASSERTKKKSTDDDEKGDDGVKIGGYRPPTKVHYAVIADRAYPLWS